MKFKRFVESVIQCTSLCYRRGYDDRYDPYGRGPLPPPGPGERGLFKPAETIDYGHKPTTSDRGEISRKWGKKVVCENWVLF